MSDAEFQAVKEAFLRGQYDDGKPALDRLVRWAREGKDPARSGHVLALAARWVGCHGDWDMAVNLSIEARWAFEDQGLGAWAPWIDAFAGLGHVQLGQVRKGRTLMDDSLAQMEDAAPELLIDVRCWYAQALLLLEERGTARGYLQESLLASRPAGLDALYRQGIVGLLLAGLEADEEEWSAVGRAAELATGWFAELGHIPYWISSRALYAMHCARLDRDAAAKSIFDVLLPLLQDTRYLVVDPRVITAAAQAVDARLAGSSLSA